MAGEDSQSRLDGQTSDERSAIRRAAKLSFVGEPEGAAETHSVPISRKKRQLLVLRGEPGVLGEAQPSVLMLLDGDKGGVMQPKSNTGVSSPWPMSMRETQCLRQPDGSELPYRPHTRVGSPEERKSAAQVDEKS
jgi:hypothetical protein